MSTHGWRRTQFSQDELAAIRAMPNEDTTAEIAPVVSQRGPGGERQPAARVPHSRAAGNASNRYQSIHEGERAAVAETYAGDTITVRGSEYEVRHEEYVAIERAAKKRKQTVAKFVHSITQVGSVDSAKQRLRAAIIPFLPDGFRWLVVQQKGKSK